MEDVRFYFDEVHQPLTPQLQTALYENANQAFNRAELIFKETGSLDQARATLAHLPSQFWPPRYIEALIGWRKAEEAAQELRIKKMQEDWAASKRSDVFPKTCPKSSNLQNASTQSRINTTRWIDLVEDVQDLASGEVESPDYLGLIAAIEGEQQSFSENISKTVSGMIDR